MLDIKDLDNPRIPGVGIIDKRRSLLRNFEIYHRNLMHMAVYAPSLDLVYVLFKIPSTNNPKSNIVDEKKQYLQHVFYDVVLEFHRVSDVAQPDSTILARTDLYKLKAYSNMPSFTFSFTWVYNKRDAISDACKKLKYPSRKALKEKPTTTNPYGVTGLDKSMIYAVHNMRRNGLFSIPVQRLVDRDNAYSVNADTFKKLIEDGILSQDAMLYLIAQMENQRRIANARKNRKKQQKRVIRKPIKKNKSFYERSKDTFNNAMQLFLNDLSPNQKDIDTELVQYKNIDFTKYYKR